MNYRHSTALVLLGLSLTALPVHADRGYGRGGFYGAPPPATGMGMSMGYRSYSSPSRSFAHASSNYGYQHMYGGRYFWGPFGLIVGSALLYSALQPRTTYTYESRTVYVPPPVTVYYAPPPAPVVSYGDYVMPATPITTVAVIPAPVPANGYSLPAAVDTNVLPGPGASGAVWWYQCRNPSGYYPYITECPAGWEKVAPAPPPPSPAP